MIDILIRCSDDAEYDATRLQYNLNDGNSHKTYVYQLGVPGVDADGNSTETQVYLPYVYVWASFNTVNQDMAADPRCMLVADSAAFARGDNFIIQTAIPTSDLDLYFVSPVSSGSRYPFGRVT